MKGFLAVVGAVLAMAALSQTVEARQLWLVEFRLPQWKTMQFQSEEKADRHLKTVEQLGCEAKKMDQEDHIAVQYRCLKWKQMKLATDEEAHRWVHYLKGIGFQTLHEH